MHLADPTTTAQRRVLQPPTVGRNVANRSNCTGWSQPASALRELIPFNPSSRNQIFDGTPSARARLRAFPTPPLLLLVSICAINHARPPARRSAKLCFSAKFAPGLERMDEAVKLGFDTSSGSVVSKPVRRMPRAARRTSSLRGAQHRRQRYRPRPPRQPRRRYTSSTSRLALAHSFLRPSLSLDVVEFTSRPTRSLDGRARG